MLGGVWWVCEGNVWPQALQVLALHLPRKMKLRCSTSLEVLRVLHLPRKIRLRCSKCCTCHAKAAGIHSIVYTQSSPGFCGPLWSSECCTCHAKWHWDAPSAAPVRTMRLRSSKCRTCHAKAAGVHSIQSSSDFRGLLWRSVGVHTTQSSPDFCGPFWRCSECRTCHAKWGSVAPCTCHAKWDWGPSSAAPAKQKPPTSIVLRLNRRWTSAGLSRGAPSAAPATQNDTEVVFDDAV